MTALRAYIPPGKYKATAVYLPCEKRTIDTLPSNAVKSTTIPMVMKTMTALNADQPLPSSLGLMSIFFYDDQGDARGNAGGGVPCILFGPLQRGVRVEDANMAERAEPRNAGSQRPQPVSC